MRVFAFLILFVGLISCTNNKPDLSIQLPEITKWVQPNAEPKIDLVALLTQEPEHCVTIPAQASERTQIELGRAAFRSPYLLGGQAARQGISCNTCHTNGDVNRHFFIEGMSSEPGTADVTNAHFSKRLGDGVYNPKPIPSLVDLQAPKTKEQEVARSAFIVRLIEKEFDGKPTNPEIKSALLAYIAALDGNACAGREFSGLEMLTYRTDLVDALIILLMDEKDEEITSFLRASLRSELGRLYDRFPQAKNVRADMVDLSTKVKSGNALELQDIANQWAKIKNNMIKEFDQSFFSPAYVAIYFD